jgi:hypothetical protein
MCLARMASLKLEDEEYIPLDDGSDGHVSGAGSFEGGRSDQPVFLRKLYQILESCPPAIASWSERGDSFVIKDPDVFAAQIIPRYYNHSNFSSFVRQVSPPWCHSDPVAFAANAA